MVFGRITIAGFTHRPEPDKKISKISLFYSSEWRSWGVISYNKSGDQIRPAEWVATKKKALLLKKELEAEYGISKKRKK